MGGCAFDDGHSQFQENARLFQCRPFGGELAGGITTRAGRQSGNDRDGGLGGWHLHWRGCETEH